MNYTVIHKQEQDKKIKLGDTSFPCYSPKQMEELYPEADYTVVGEVKNRSSKKEIGKLENDHTVSEQGAHSSLFNRKVGYLCVDKDTYIVALRPRILLWWLLSGLILLVLIALMALRTPSVPSADFPQSQGDFQVSDTIQRAEEEADPAKEDIGLTDDNTDPADDNTGIADDNADIADEDTDPTDKDKDSNKGDNGPTGGGGPGGGGHGPGGGGYGPGGGGSTGGDGSTEEVPDGEIIFTGCRKATVSGSNPSIELANPSENNVDFVFTVKDKATGQTLATTTKVSPGQYAYVNVWNHFSGSNGGVLTIDVLTFPDPGNVRYVVLCGGVTFDMEIEVG